MLFLYFFPQRGAKGVDEQKKKRLLTLMTQEKALNL
jgi:hypothetical protein